MPTTQTSLENFAHLYLQTFFFPPATQKCFTKKNKNYKHKEHRKTYKDKKDIYQKKSTN